MDIDDDGTIGTTDTDLARAAFEPGATGEGIEKGSATFPAADPQIDGDLILNVKAGSEDLRQ